MSSQLLECTNEDLGIMGVISATVASGGGHITGVIPSAMVEGGGEGRRDEAITNGRPAELYGRVVIEKQKADNVSYDFGSIGYH